MLACDDMQLKDVLEQRKAELTASYERLLQHIAATRKQVGFPDVTAAALMG